MVMTSFWYSGLTLTANVRGTAQLLASVLSTLPVQAVSNAAFYAMQHLLDCLAVSSMLLSQQLPVTLCVRTELMICSVIPCTDIVPHVTCLATTPLV